MMRKTPLGQVRGLGSAKSGTEHWWVQRMTALAGVPLVIFLVIFIVMHLGSTRAEIIASMQNPLVAVLMALTIITQLWHMRLGMQVIIEDYVHGQINKFLALTFNTAFSVAMGAIAIYAILKMSFGL
jgi:succinate dehydrogenase / fumarate reductase membrane anchor subunit